jgi:23S rRNA pseudouridine1911/1915/1917 synthase
MARKNKKGYFDLSDLRVVYEDNHLVAVNKPGGLLVHGDETGDESLADLVKEFIKIRYDKPGEVFLGTIHRIDRPTSGTVIFARTSKALERMNKLFAEQAIKKTYYAVVKDRPSPIIGHLTHWLLKDGEKNITRAYDAPSNRNKGSKQSELDYEMVGDLNGHYLLKINPHTGRQHQIRAQLSQIGVPICGDLKYGAKTPHVDGRSIYLHCFSMEFVHPVTKEPIRIESELPENDSLWGMMRGIIGDF